jgi:glycosyltransferase involved in cell wall biosynthesis
MQYFYSIIIPIFNSKKYLYSSIQSVVDQRNDKTEIILVNDCSTDGSKKICNFYKKKFNFIKVINNNKNLGVGYSRNIAIKAAKGKYIVFLDSDDNLLKNSLNNLEKFIIEKSSPDVIPIRYKKITFPQNNDKFIKDNLGQKNVNNLIKYVMKKQIPFSDCWFFVVKRTFLSGHKIYFPNSRFGESEIFVAKIICYMKNFAIFKNKFYHKKDRLNSLTNSSDYNTTYSVLNNLIEFNTFYNKLKFSNLKKKFLSRYMQGIFGVFLALVLLRKKNEIKKLSLLLKINKKNLKNLTKYPENLNLEKLVKKFGVLGGLIKFKDSIIDLKISKFKELNIKNKYFYAYCRSQYTAATINIFKKNGYKITGVVDDNINFKNSRFLNYKTIDSKFLLKKFKLNLNKLFIIITHQKKNTFKKISNHLLKNNISKKQIFYIKY